LILELKAPAGSTFVSIPLPNHSGNIPALCPIAPQGASRLEAWRAVTHRCVDSALTSL